MNNGKGKGIMNNGKGKGKGVMNNGKGKGVINNGKKKERDDELNKEGSRIWCNWRLFWTIGNVKLKIGCANREGFHTTFWDRY